MSRVDGPGVLGYHPGEAKEGMTALLNLLISMRPKQWTKNVIIFLALLFSIDLYWKPAELSATASLLGTTVIAFVLFCLLSSAEYLINDVVDRESDAQHPLKRHRPVPSGRLAPSLAIGVAALLAAISLGLSFRLQLGFGLIALTYLALMLAYTFVLKHLVIIDVFTIAAGFVLRAVAGGVVIGVPISPWLYICTLLGALFIGLGKRRNELVVLNNNAPNHRSVLTHYTPQLLEQMIAVVTSSTVIAYSLYTFSAAGLPQNHAMMLTIPFVLYGIFRYLYLIHSRNLGGSPEEALLTDLPLLVDIILWAVSATAILLLFRS